MTVTVRLRELNSVFNVIYLLTQGNIIAIMHLADSLVIIKPAVNTTSCRAGKAQLFVILQLGEILEKPMKNEYMYAIKEPIFKLRSHSFRVEGTRLFTRVPSLFQKQFSRTFQDFRLFFPGLQKRIRYNNTKKFCSFVLGKTLLLYLV